jgi:hypothetical protein
MLKLTTQYDFHELFLKHTYHFVSALKLTMLCFSESITGYSMPYTYLRMHHLPVLEIYKVPS